MTPEPGASRQAGLGGPGLLVMLAGVLLAAFSSMGLFNADYLGLTAKMNWFMFAAGVGIIVLGWSGLRGAWHFGVLTAALFIGGAAQLWMTEPLWFPALRFRPESQEDLLMIALIAGQGIIAGGTLILTGALGALSRFFAAFGLMRIIVFLGLSGLFAVSPLGYLSYGGYVSFAAHLIGGAAMIMLNLATVAAMLRVRGPGLYDNTFHPLVPALLAGLIALILSVLAFERLPHVEDEVAFLFQAKTFAGGALSVPALPEATLPGLEHYLLEVREGRWFSTTPPGWPALLSLGILIGAEWLINPVLAVICVLLGYGVTRAFAPTETARTVALLMAVSPWYLGTAGSLMPHMITLTLTLFAWWALLVSREAGARVLLWALLAGLAMGWMFAARQLEALILGTLTGIWLLTLFKEHKGVPRILAYGIGCIAAGSLYLAFNYAMTGDALLDPLKRYLDESWGVGGNAYGFGPEIGPPGGWGALDLAPGHSVFEGLINAVNNITALSIEHLGWGTGSLALFWIFVFYARPTRFELAMAAVSVLVIGALFLYWFSGSFYIGPRYWFSVFFPLVLFSAKGFELLQERLGRLGVHKDQSVAVLMVLCLFSVAVFTSWRGVEKYFEYNTFHSYPREVARSGDLEGAIVFFNPEVVDAGSALNENDPWQRSGTPLFIRDLGAEVNTEVINALPGRTVVYLGNEE